MMRLWGRKSSINVQKVLWCLAELGLKEGKDFERRVRLAELLLQEKDIDSNKEIAQLQMANKQAMAQLEMQLEQQKLAAEQTRQAMEMQGQKMQMQMDMIQQTMNQHFEQQKSRCLLVAFLP